MNSLYDGRIGSFGGVRIIESTEMVDWHEDWSEVRSPARARRRMHKHPQRIKRYSVHKTEAFQLPNGTLIMHPEMARKLKRKLET